MTHEELVATSDGRTLRVVSGGDPDGLCVLVQHPTPSDGSLYRPHVEDARDRGIRLIGYDRPGYRASDARPGRIVADCAEDVKTIADVLGLDRLAVWGISGGGPHALACGALLPDRVVAVASLASVAPVDAEGLDWFAGMGAENVAEFHAAVRGRADLEPVLAAMRADICARDAAQLRDAFLTLLTDVDAAALTGEYAEFVHASMLHALEDGIEGWLEDDCAFAAPWGFDVAAVDVPVLLWHGEHDRFVPTAHGRWLVERLPHVEPHLSDEDGHLTLATQRIEHVHAWLVERLRAH